MTPQSFPAAVPATQFHLLNSDWNADPNAPYPKAAVEGGDLVLRFGLNRFLFPRFTDRDIGQLRFTGCRRYRFDDANDHDWVASGWRYGKLAPDWGNFYEVTGELYPTGCPEDWTIVDDCHPGRRHFMFQFRDETFECDADDWSFTVVPVR